MNSMIIVLDCSGSMGEMSKMLLARNLIAVVCEYPEIQDDKNSFDSIHLYLWNDSIEHHSLENNIEVPFFTASGSANLKQLVNTLESIDNKYFKTKVMILSDGALSEQSINEYQVWLNSQEYYCIRAVAIGADAELDKLSQLSTNSQAYSSEDILVAIKSLINGLDRDIALPLSLKDFSLLSKQDDEGGWE